MRDPEYDPEGTRHYECFTCGTVATARETLDSCPDCSGQMRNRLIPVE